MGKLQIYYYNNVNFYCIKHFPYGDTMKKIMVLTSMRVGSTWICYFLQHALGKDFQYTENINEVERLWEKYPVVKAHRLKDNNDEIVFSKDTATREIIERFPDAYIITVVRNPKGRISSQIHFRPPVKARIERIINQGLEWSNGEQFSRMLEGYSSMASLENREHKYLWTTYEWLLEDPYREFSKILKFVGVNSDPDFVKQTVDYTQRDQMDGGRIRAGMKDSWKHERFADKLGVFDEHEKKYYDMLDREITLDK